MEQIAADFGVHPLAWSGPDGPKDDVEDGVRPGVTAAESADLHEANKRIRRLEQENETLGGGASFPGPTCRDQGSTRS